MVQTKSLLKKFGVEIGESYKLKAESTKNLASALSDSEAHTLVAFCLHTMLRAEAHCGNVQQAIELAECIC